MVGNDKEFGKQITKGAGWIQLSIAVVFIFLSHWATALSPSIFDAIIPIFSEVTLYKTHNALLGQSLCFQMKEEAPLARWSYNELGGGMGSSVICSISVLMVLSTHSFIYSLFIIFLNLPAKEKILEYFPWDLGQRPRSQQQLEVPDTVSQTCCALFICFLCLFLLSLSLVDKRWGKRAGDTWSCAPRALEGPLGVSADGI